VAEQAIVANVTSAKPHAGYDLGKRVFDLLGASGLLLVTWPVMLVASALILFTSGWPVLFRQKRMGKNGQTFDCLKFRTMIKDAESRRAEVLHMNMLDGPAFKLKDDPRLTAVGKQLRRFSIDELPQLFNVLSGEMSLVGPRPLPIIENNYHGDQALRLTVKPGLTCVWQISGRSNVSFDEWMRMDVDYVRTRSLWGDFVLIMRTIPAVLSFRGAV